jgi:hypothetical protein
MVAHEARLKDGENISPLLGQLDKHGGSFWEEAPCRTAGDPDAWFIDYNTGDEDELWRLNNALRICDDCPIKDKCLEVGVTSSELNWGVWGGLLPGERMLLVKPFSKLGPNGRQAVKNAMALRSKIEDLKDKANKGRGSRSK